MKGPSIGHILLVVAALAAVPLLGERLDALTVGFALAVIATVFVGKRLPTGARA